MKKQELRFYLFLAGVCAVLGIACQFSLPIRLDGGVFFGGLAVGCAGEAYALHKAECCPICKWISRIGRVVFCLFLCSFVLIQGMIAWGARPDAAAEDADYVLVLGGRVVGDQPAPSLALRLDTARDFLERNPESRAVMCGGQGWDEMYSEAEVMQRYLIARGIDPAQLLIEDQSHNTLQNVANAKKLLPERVSTAVITSDFHLARARRIMSRAGLDPVGLPSKTPGFALAVVSRLREYGATLGLILTGRYF